MAKSFPVKFDESMLESLRARAADDGLPVAQVIKRAVALYLSVKPKAESSAKPEPSRTRPTTAPPAAAPSVPSASCRYCFHAERLHRNTSVSSGSGCDYMGCPCRRFIADDEEGADAGDSHARE